MNKLQKELVRFITGGWTSSERKTEWKSFLVDEVKPYYPEMYKLLKDVKELSDDDY